jgi:predicted nucleic acid-binding protein
VKVVADTSVLVDHLRGDERPMEMMRAAIERGDGISASEASRIELLAGVRAGEEQPLLRLFALLDWIPIDREVAEVAGDLTRRFRHSHPGVGLADYAIAATAKLSEADLWTLNLRHFPMFPELERPY